MKKHLFKHQSSKKNALLYKIFCASILGSSLLVQDQLATAGPQPNKQEKYYISKVENNSLISNQPIHNIHQYISNHSLSQNFTSVNLGDKGHKGPGGGSGGGENKNHKRLAHNSQEPNHASISQKNYIPSVISLSSDKVGIKKDQNLYTNSEEKKEEHPLKKETPKLKPIPIKDQLPRKLKPKLKPITDEDRIPSPNNDPFGFSKWAHTSSPKHKASSLKVANNQPSHDTQGIEVANNHTPKLQESPLNPHASSSRPINNASTPESLEEAKQHAKTLIPADINQGSSQMPKKPEPSTTFSSSQLPYGKMMQWLTSHGSEQSQNSPAEAGLPAAAQIIPAAAAQQKLPAGAPKSETTYTKPQITKQDEFRKIQHITAVEEDFIIRPIIGQLIQVDLSSTEKSMTDDLEAANELQDISSLPVTRTSSGNVLCPLSAPTRGISFTDLEERRQLEEAEERRQLEEAVRSSSKLHKYKELSEDYIQEPQLSSNSPTSTQKHPRSSLENNCNSCDEKTLSQEGEAGEIKTAQKDSQSTKILKENTQGTFQSINPETTELAQGHHTQLTSDPISKQTKIQNYANRSNLVHLQLHALQAIANHMETWSSYASISLSSVLPAAGEYDEESLPLLTGLMKKGTFVPWISGHYGKSIQGKVKDRAAYRGDLGGVSIGTDFVLNECTVLGVSYSKITSKVKYRQDRLGNNEITDSQTFTLYGQYNFNDTLFAQSALAYTKGLTKHNLKNQESYKSSSKGFAGFVSLNNVFAVSKNTFIVPRVGLRYIQNKEKDVQVGDTKIIGAKNRYLTAILGSKILLRKNFGEVSITPGLYAGLEQPIVVKNQGAKASIIEAGKTFEYQCPASKSKNLSYNLGAEISAKRKNLVLSLSYQCSLARKYTSHQGSLKIGIAF